MSAEAYELKLFYVKSTKNKDVYKAQPDATQDAPTESIYISKTAFEGVPESITITITADR